ncbi:tRNA-dihydrouridine synthase family protein, partial [candidate division WOR-3 bacterium]|nr:tRNA-dihydrouridine synthase family protein [candidate division WOR-3 bacterium]
MRIELAPLDGISDRPFRTICRRCGAAHVTTEMIPVQGIVSNPERYLKKADFSEEERPLTIQIAGSDVSKIKKAVSFINPLSPDFIELNAGCPARRILKSGNGAALLKDLDKLSSCIFALLDSSKYPVSVKTRIGFDFPFPEELASVFEKTGVACVKIHGRTALQNYSVRSDLKTVEYISSLLKAPVTANGDIDSFEKACSTLERGFFAGAMIGRAARGDPWIFSGIVPGLEERQ